jgi:hypothetical protein
MKLATPVRHGRSLATLARPFTAGATSRSGVCLEPAATAWRQVGTYAGRILKGGGRREHIQHTVRYTELAPDRFKDFWR